MTTQIQCQYCTDDADSCSALSVTKTYVCTRPKGHQGQHVACGATRLCIGGHEFKTWEADNEHTS